ncbi:MAG: ABC transporter ATP-binding protein [Candidatus Kapaibacterium sp.]|nr:MAG: ABC transporter ATP-binding protein [Candidatus Kapabacteria bacterium]
MTLITLDHLEKRYDNGFEAVRNLSLRLESGKFTVLLGPSGCGKSTTLRMIAGLESITAGELRFDNERMNEALPKHRDIGMVFQNYALYPHLSVFENIAFPLRLRREAKADVDARVREVAGMTGLAELLDRKPKELSGGQRQRVALGRAIVRKPRVFLFDEPLSNLDAQLRTQMRVEISRLQRVVGSTAVYVTHDQTEAMTMADTIVVMNKGELQQTGTPQEIYNNPANRFVAGFLGSPTMNFFEGNFSQTPQGWHFQEQDGMRLHHAQSTILSAFQGKATLGIRPENIAFTPFENDAASDFANGSAEHALSFSAKIERIEFLGNEKLVYFSTQAESPAPLKVLRASIGGASADIGAKRTLFVKQDASTFFNERGERIDCR